MTGAFDKLATIRSALPNKVAAMPQEDEFLSASDLVPVRRQAVETRQRAVWGEMEELFREKRWQEIEERLLKLKSHIEELIDHTEDTVRYYTLCKGCLKNVEYSGVGDRPDPAIFKVI